MSSVFGNGSNPKNDLLEISQIHFGASRPEYIHFPYGPPHDTVFVCICTFQNEITSCQGQTKKEAELFCSRDMIEKLRGKFFDIEHNVWKPSEERRAAVFLEIDAHIQYLNKAPNFEALRLLGNAVLRSYISAHLFHKYSQFSEDLLTRITLLAMDRKNRAKLAISLELNQFFNCEPTIRKLAEFLDATIGTLAVQDREDLCVRFLNAGYQKFIEETVKRIFEDKSFSKQQSQYNSYIKTEIHNYKSDLFELAQKKRRRLPSYRTIEITGSDHSPLFTVCCSFTFRQPINYGRNIELTLQQTMGYGKSIKSAEQDASKKMFELFRKSEITVTRTIGQSLDQKYEPTLEQQQLGRSELSNLERNLGYNLIDDSAFLNEALTHPSTNTGINYQRLEFLGDALLRKILLFYIVQTYPSINSQKDIGESISFLASASTQAEIVTKLNIDRYIFTKTDLTESILSDVLEALIAAIYLDKKIMASVSLCVIVWYKDILNQCFEKNVSKSESSSYLSKEAQKFSQISDSSFSESLTAGKPTFAQIARKEKTYTAKSKYPLFQPRPHKEKIAIPDIGNLAEFPSLAKKSNG